MRIAAVLAHARSRCQVLVTRHLPSLAVGERLSHRLGSLAHLVGKRGQCTLSRCIRHFAQQYQAGPAYHQYARCRQVAGVRDQVPVPMPQHHASIGFEWTNVDGDNLRNLAAPISARRARSARAFALAQERDELVAQFSQRVGVDEGVVALVAGAHGRIVGVHAECAGNLLARPVPAKRGVDQVPHTAVAVQLGKGSGINASPLALALGRGAIVAVPTSIAPQLAADGAGAAPLHLIGSPRSPSSSDATRPVALSMLQVRVSRFPL